MREAHKNKNQNFMWKCIVKWTEKGRHWVSAQGAPFSTNFIFCNPYSYYSRFFFFFFITFDVFFLAPISMLRFSAPFPTPLTPLDPFRFLYVFVNFLVPFLS